jgi:transcriptional regulator with XRE-family HTH domain
VEPVEKPLVGRNIQNIRKKRNLTLGVLAEKSGVSKAMLSQIEAEKVNPTVAMVWKIAQGLGVELQDLLSGGAEMTRKFNVVRKDSITTLDTKNDEVHLQVLSPISMVDDIEMYLLTFRPGGTLSSSPHFPRTEEYLTIIKGEVEVTAGEHTTHLHEGDFIDYHCDVDHQIKNVGQKAAVIHMVVRFHKRSLE